MNFVCFRSYSKFSFVCYQLVLHSVQLTITGARNLPNIIDTESCIRGRSDGKLFSLSEAPFPCGFTLALGASRFGPSVCLTCFLRRTLNTLSLKILNSQQKSSWRYLRFFCFYCPIRWIEKCSFCYGDNKMNSCLKGEEEKLALASCGYPKLNQLPRFTIIIMI